MRYQVNSAYSARSDGQQWGPWEPGQEVDLDEDRAAWVNRDAPGTLVPAKAKPPAANRQHRGGANRST